MQRSILCLIFVGMALFYAHKPCAASWSYVPIRPADPKLFHYKEPAPYLSPGVIFLGGGRYNGRDNLLGLPCNVRVATTIINVGVDQIWLTEQQAQKELEFALMTSGIDICPPIVKPEDPYRPTLHLQATVYPVEGGYAVMTSLRLLEKVDCFERGELLEGEVWQAITWEKECMFFSCLGDLHGSIGCHVKLLADQFTREYTVQNNEAQVKNCRPKKTRPQLKKLRPRR